ncbi:ESCRT-II subunit protein snf8 [Podila verticillata]|nr:ESCRT-II subunit protein snf8 [Podila verticillata]
MSSETIASSKGRGPSAMPESTNTLPSTNTPAPVANTTTPSSNASTSIGVEPPSPAGRRRTGHQVLEDMKASLRRLSAQVEQLGDMIENLELHENDHEKASTPRISILKKGDRNRGPTLGRRASKFSGGGGRTWKPFEVKITAHQNLDPVRSLDALDLKEATLKNLLHDGTHELHLSRAILGPLISGEDCILQLRGPLLDDYVTYTLIDIIDKAKPELCIVIIVTRLEIASTKRLLGTLAKKLEVGKLHANQFTIDRGYELGPLSKTTPIKPRIYVTTPDMLLKLKDANLLHPDHTHVMVVFEAEYVMRNSRQVQSIKSVLEEMKVTQAVLAVKEMTEDVMNATESLDFKADAVWFSMDHEHMTNATHYYFWRPLMEEAVLNRAAELSKEYPVVILGHDSADVARLKETLGSKAQVTPEAAVLGPNMLSHGIFVAHYGTRFSFVGKPRTGVRLLVSLSRSPLILERHLAVMATYMDVGESCNIVFKMNSHDDVPILKTTGADAAEITDTESFQRVGQSISDSQMEQLQSQLDTFRANLETFARLHRKDIQKDPVFRMHFQKMCGNIGVDPLASSKGYWGELLGVGDFYYELGIQIIDVCLSTRALNGGLMELSEVKRRVERMRGVRDNKAPAKSGNSKWASMIKETGMEVTEDDVLRSIKTLAPLGSGFQVFEIGNKKMVSSVPRELNKDQSIILGLVQQTNGHVNATVIGNKLGWEGGRIKTALDTLLEDSLMWIDMQAEPHEYWVPGFFEPEEDDIYATTATA